MRRTKQVRLALLLTVGGLVGCFGSSPVRAQVQPGGDASGLIVFDFGSFSGLIHRGITTYVAIEDPDLGVAIGEKLVGQVLSIMDGFDVVSGTPTAPLALDTSVPASSSVNVLNYRGSPVVDGLGSANLSLAGAIGVGALTFLFDNDQSFVGFNLVGAHGGVVRVQFFDRNATPIGDLTIDEAISGAYVFGSENTGIAAMVVTNRDFGGMGFSDLILQPTPSDRPTLCNLPTSYDLSNVQQVNELSLDAGVTDGLDHTYQWMSDCPGGFFDDATSPNPTLFVDGADVCQVDCTVTVLVDVGELMDACSASVAIGGGGGVGLTCPDDAVVESDGAGNVAETHAWLDGATTSDGTEPVVTAEWMAGDCGDTGYWLATWSVDGVAGDDCSGATQCSATCTVVDTTGPVLAVDDAPVVVADEFCDGSAFVAMPDATATDSVDGDTTVTWDAPDAFPAGETTTVTYTATDDCGNETSASVDVTVLFGSGVRVVVEERSAGTGHGDGSDSVPLPGALVSAFDMSKFSCANDIAKNGQGRSWQEFERILATCAPMNAMVSDTDGVAPVDLPPGNFLLVVSIDSDDDGVDDVFLGHELGAFRCGKWKAQRILWLHNGGGR